MPGDLLVLENLLQIHLLNAKYRGEFLIIVLGRKIIIQLSPQRTN